MTVSFKLPGITFDGVELTGKERFDTIISLKV